MVFTSTSGRPDLADDPLAGGRRPDELQQGPVQVAGEQART
jgi:hypothetical protein